MTKKEEFRNLLKGYGVTKCYVSPNFDFEADEPNGDIFININETELLNKIFDLFTKDGYVSEDQMLGVFPSDFRNIKPNFII